MTTLEDVRRAAREEADRMTPKADPFAPGSPETTTRSLGDRVRFTGTVEKKNDWPEGVHYVDAGLPGFVGYEWAPGKNGVTFTPIGEGFIVGKRRYVSMYNEEGLWVPDGRQVFDAYLVAYHLRRNPVIVREDQITESSESEEK